MLITIAVFSDAFWQNQKCIVLANVIYAAVSDTLGRASASSNCARDRRVHTVWLILRYSSERLH